MKVLQLMEDCFEQLPKTSNLALFLFQRAKVLGYENFFNLFIQYVGGRGYNQFLDYGLFALKLNNIFGKEIIDGKFIAPEMTFSLLHDDRHDLYQNLPYGIQKCKIENKWKLATIALIESFNENGTGDVKCLSKMI
jgi:hypothetical protein